MKSINQIQTISVTPQEIEKSKTVKIYRKINFAFKNKATGKPNHKLLRILIKKTPENSPNSIYFIIHFKIYSVTLG